MSWARDRFADETSRNNRNHHHHGEFEYDSADLPFSPPTRNTGYLESGIPFWKTNIADPDKYLCPPPAQTGSASDQSFSPLFKFVTSNSRSNENVSLGVNSTPSRPYVSQSLPATPLSTPGPTPVPTPQSSPSTNRREIVMDTPRVNQDQLSSKWFYLGFRSATQAPGSGALEVSGGAHPVDDPSQISADSLRSSMAKFDSKDQEFRPLTYLQKRAVMISNRDMNFLAPTSM